MTISEMAKRSGYSRQRLNKLVDLGYAHGARRKPSGRLEVFDEKLATRWCDFLGRRKAVRRQNNQDRIEKRVIRQNRKRFFSEFVPAFLKGLARELPDYEKKMARQTHALLFEKTGKTFSDDLVREFVQDQARQIFLDQSRATELQKDAFAFKGRKRTTRAARGALFDYEIGKIDFYKSWADIAQDFGCTRAALSAAAKQLPPGLCRSRRRN
jgi:CRP-like cAMP-binding protein